ncbi:hypothetical protein DMN91_006144 [Ooceraea biroi]|uniref:Uncharacterized protein n=1 Tax=Ooceraea biroi TaxID=2015173 RepID=A0A3L8DPM2_OOCBI|nr:hypothetical protein DMN91_006144 [Ooceraea biroi]
MCQPLPRGEFRWVEDVSTLDVQAIPPDSHTGYILEVDLEYPRYLHDAHADLPFCPTRKAPPDKRQEKLLATLCDKQRRAVFGENLLAVELQRLKATFNRPIYVGMCILDISKMRLYEFHYDYMAPLYGDKCRIMYTDTDSLIYRIECEDASAGEELATGASRLATLKLTTFRLTTLKLTTFRLTTLILTTLRLTTVPIDHVDIDHGPD